MKNSNYRSQIQTFLSKNVIIKLITLSLSILLIGCSGYRLGSIKPTYLADVNSIYIPTAKNLTLLPRIGSLLTTGVVQEVQKDGTYRVKGMNNSDARVSLIIRKVDRYQLSSVRGDILTSNRLGYKLYVEVDIVDKVNSTSFRKFNVIGLSDAFLDDNQQVTERVALAHAIRDASIKVSQYLAEGI